MSYNSTDYTRQRVDSETGLMPPGNGERYYLPSSGRFIQQDSMTGRLDIPPSLNRFAYAHDSPVNHTDPSGHIVPLLVLAAFLAVVAVDVAVQDYQIRSGTRAQTDFSMSEAGTMAAMQMPVLGNGIRALAGVDPLTGEQLGKGRRVFEGAMSVLDLWFVASAARGAIRGARAGSEAAGVLSEGRALARTGRGALSSATTEAEAGRSALSVVEETSQLRAGASKAERATEEMRSSAIAEEGLGLANGDDGLIEVYRVQSKTQTEIVTGGAFRRARERGATLVEANMERRQLLEDVFHENPRRKVKALENAQASGRKSPFISTTKNRALAESNLMTLRATGQKYELLTIRGPGSAGVDFEEVFKALGGRNSASRIKDASLDEFGIPDLFISPNKPSRSGFYIVGRE